MPFVRSGISPTSLPGIEKKMVYKIGMNISSLVNDHLLNETEKATLSDQVAFEFRNAVKKMPINKLPQKL